MPKATKPRSGSMQFWPRKRAKRIYPGIHKWQDSKDSKLLGFAGYKVGMGHIIIDDARKKAVTAGEKIFMPITLIECPPIKIYAVNLYKQGEDGLQIAKTIVLSNDKILNRKTNLPKKPNSLEIDKIKPEDYKEIKAVIYTQPSKTSIGKKKPEIFETAIGGTNEEKIKFIKDNTGKEIQLKDVFSDGEIVDIHAVTKGKGTQGPVKRFGIGLRSHKSEKTKRGPGSLGPWIAQGKIMYRVAHAGQMGYQTRTEHNKKIIKISDDVKEINPKGGFNHYGEIKNPYVIIKGSIAGPAKRIIRFIKPIRAKKSQLYEPGKIHQITLNK